MKTNEILLVLRYFNEPIKNENGMWKMTSRYKSIEDIYELSSIKCYEKALKIVLKIQ